MFIRLFWVVGMAGLWWTLVLLAICCLCVSLLSSRRHRITSTVVLAKDHYAVTDASDLDLTLSGGYERCGGEWRSLLHHQVNFLKQYRLSRSEKNDRLN